MATEELRTMTIADAGRGLKIGELYDARTNKVVQGAYLWENVSENIISINAPYTSLEFKRDMSFQSRFSLLKVDMYIKIWLLFFPLTGSVSFLQTKLRTARSERMVAQYSTRNRHETISAITKKMIHDANTFDFSKEGECPSTPDNDGTCNPATHFVSAITYGSDVYIDFEEYYENFQQRDKIMASFIGITLLNKDNGGNSYDYKRTTVTVTGDFNLGEKLPSTVPAALDFIERLPSIANDEVPMEVVLTPMSWLDSDFVIPTIVTIDENILRRVVNVLDSIELAEAHILDALSIDYGGFIVWKKSLDIYYRAFVKYRASLETKIKNGLEQVRNEKATQDTLLVMADDYWLPSNVYNEFSVTEESERRENSIKSLLALSSQFEDAGITFATKLSDYQKSTVNTGIDRTYALVLVGLHPENQRDELQLVRDFVDLAKNRIKPQISTKIEHCVWSQVGDRILCGETLKFVAIHFDSFCGDLCDSQFCPKEGEPELCSSTSTVSPCDYDSDAAETHQCTSNTFTGSCYIDSSKNPVPWEPDSAITMNPKHSIDNHNQPLSDCWCSCPRTQIMEFVKNQNPKRLTSDMPRVPLTPVISHVSGEKFDEMEDYGTNQRIELVLHDNPNTDKFKVTLSKTKSDTTENGDVSFTVHEKVVLTPSYDTEVALTNLDAGQTYSIDVTGINSVGEGYPSDQKKVKIGHRMADIYLDLKPEEESPPIRTLQIPSFLNVVLHVRLSTEYDEKMFRVTIHESKSAPGSVEEMIGINDGEIYNECQELRNVTWTGSACTLNANAVAIESDKEMELRVWDDSELLIAKSSIYMMAKSNTQCSVYGC